MIRPLCYRGTVNTWECDEMGHMNVRFYLTKAHQGLQHFLHKLGLGPAALAELGLEPVFLEQHIRYMRELHAGSDLSIHAGAVDADRTGLTVYQEVLPLRSDDVSATMITRLVLRDPSSGALKDIPEQVIAAAGRFQDEIPGYAMPRSLPLGETIPVTSAEEAVENGHLEISVGTVRGSQVDRNGYLYPDEFMGFLSDGIGNLFGLLTKDLDTRIYERSEEIGGAALEYRFEFLRRPRHGDLVRVLSAPVEILGKAYKLRHILVDGESGAVYARAQSVHCAFNLKTRKAVDVPPLLRAGLEAHLAQK